MARNAVVRAQIFATLSTAGSQFATLEATVIDAALSTFLPATKSERDAVLAGSVSTLAAPLEVPAAQGSFSIISWKGYPSGLPKPSGPVHLVEGAEYTQARAATNASNRAAHRADASLAGKHVHETQPVKFGGSPTDPANKVALSPKEHHEASSWWAGLLRYLQE